MPHDELKAPQQTAKEMRTQLVLNVAPIYFKDAPIGVEWLDYENHEQLRALRDAHNATHVFKREVKAEGDRIVCVPVTSKAPSITGESGIIYLNDNFPLCCSIIRNSLINYIASMGRRVLDYRPIKFVAGGPKDELLSASPIRGLEYPEWLTVHPRFEASVREFRLDNQPPFIGLALDVRTMRNVSWNCAQLMDVGFDPTGLYVRKRTETADPRIYPRHWLVGKVVSVEQGVLHLTDSRPGVNSIAAKEAYLETRQEAFNRCLSFAFKEFAPHVTARLETQLVNIRRGPERLSRLQRVLGYL